MAILKQRLCRKNSSGTYDSVYFETAADLVLMSDGTTAQATITGISSDLSSHTGNSTVHVTSADKTNWNGKQDANIQDDSVSGDYYNIGIDNGAMYYQKVES